MTTNSKKGLGQFANQLKAKKAWARPSFQKIEVAARINATNLLKLDPTGTLS
ncbi:hypothetical protein [Emticicia sp. 21SJ11W-3]|uniref:hypothetical protein n=1 Tax=Emticicia sp. 21SJ11W-3 TaxID=2916755 RepID=UPI00209D3B03|nr:hypothetical protein [Emticicia sp. 21SJ11W-3]UTA66637.1 hypothetical protein MB380_13605 [Emticicia sp. 21SJ11W-3]